MRTITTTSRIAIALAALGLILSLAHLGAGGLRTGGDTGGYVAAADQLLDGEPMLEKGRSYIGFVAVLALFKATGVDLMWLAILQCILGAAAILCVYSLGRRLAGSAAGVTAAALMAVDLDLSRFHSYVLTDSLYITGVTVTSWLISEAAERRSPRWYLGTLLGCCAVMTIRPSGLVMLPIAGIYLAVRAPLSAASRSMLSVMAVILFLVVALGAPSGFRATIERETPAELLRKGEVIWNHEELRIDMPAGGSSGTDLSSAASYVLDHPVASARLFLTRIGTELAHVRYFYSPAHNLAVAGFLAIVYPLALVGAWISRRRPQIGLHLAIIGMHLLIVALTFADHDGRWLLYFLPQLFVLAGTGAAALFKKMPSTLGRQPLDTG